MTEHPISVRDRRLMAGLLPIMWSHGTGAEVMQRIAVPMIGGMVSSTVPPRRGVRE